MPIRVGVISDTHNLVESTKKVTMLASEMGVKKFIHCGDICNVEIVDLLSKFHVDFVYGNCDIAKVMLAQKIKETGNVIHGRFGEVEWEQKKIAFLHGDDDMLLDRESRKEKWDLICYGHTHKHILYQVQNTLVLNPGALQRRYELPGFCVVELPSLRVIRIPIE
ncbi:MAG: metallophosphoesterase family protein [Planctomycetia bacterium]|nr:metallophosphoesterase family protein [Planctomycetia bacterium]